MQVLYGRHHVRVFRFGLRLVRDEQIAEDLISEVFLDVWRQAGKFEGRSAVTTWLLAIARFKALSALRRRKDVGLDDETANAIEDTSDDPEVVAQNYRMASLTQALVIDLTGQVCADQFHGEFYSGVSTQPDFHRGAAGAREGKPIVCLRSTTDDGKESRIRPSLLAGEGVTLARSDVHYVVTEFGIAYLFGKSVRERAMALI